MLQKLRGRGTSELQKDSISSSDNRDNSSPSLSRERWGLAPRFTVGDCHLLEQKTTQTRLLRGSLRYRRASRYLGPGREFWKH